MTGEPDKSPPQIPTFQLPDQFGAIHPYCFPRKRPLLLLVGDRKGSEQVEAWIAPLKERWAGVSDIAGVADVSAVPRFLWGRIPNAIRRARPAPVMLDFEGDVTGTLRCTPRAADVPVVAPEGWVVTHVSGSPKPGHLDRIATALSPWLPARATPSPAA